MFSQQQGHVVNETVLQVDRNLYSPEICSVSNMTSDLPVRNMKMESLFLKNNIYPSISVC